MTDAMQKLIRLLGETRKGLADGDHGEYAASAELLSESLDRLQRAVTRPPRVLVAGEANAGKTSVANMLAGLDVLPAAVIANTAVPVLLRSGPETVVSALTENGRRPISAAGTAETLPKFLYNGLQRIDVQLPGLAGAGFDILDTPAWPSRFDLIDESDILIWCSVAQRPWTESERSAVSALPERLRRRGLLVVTHKDSLSEADRAKVEARYRELAGPLFADIVMVDAGTRPLPADDTAGAPAGVRIGGDDSADLRAALQARVDDFWAHRAVTGRRLCRHMARLVKPLLPTSSGNGETRPKADPAAARLTNIAGRLAAA